MNATIITCMLNIGRKDIGRDFSFYTESFKNFSKIRLPLVIYTQKEYVDLVWAYRSPGNTEIRIVTTDDLANFLYFDQIEKIKQSPIWNTRAKWIKKSPQYLLKYYIPLIMMKPFWLKDTALSNPFSTSHFYWLDAGIFSNPKYGYMGEWIIKDLVPAKKFILLSYRSKLINEANGMELKTFNNYCGTKDIRWWVLGGLFGGRQNEIFKFVELYNATLAKTLKNGDMGTEENIFTILSSCYPQMFNRQRLWLNRFSTGVFLETMRKFLFRMSKR